MSTLDSSGAYPSYVGHASFYLLLSSSNATACTWRSLCRMHETSAHKKGLGSYRSRTTRVHRTKPTLLVDHASDIVHKMTLRNDPPMWGRRQRRYPVLVIISQQRSRSHRSFSLRLSGPRRHRAYRLSPHSLPHAALQRFLGHPYPLQAVPSSRRCPQ